MSTSPQNGRAGRQPGPLDDLDDQRAEPVEALADLARLPDAAAAGAPVASAIGAARALERSVVDDHVVEPDGAERVLGERSASAGADDLGRQAVDRR